MKRFIIGSFIAYYDFLILKMFLIDFSCYIKKPILKLFGFVQNVFAFFCIGAVVSKLTTLVCASRAVRKKQNHYVSFHCYHQFVVPISFAFFARFAFFCKICFFLHSFPNLTALGCKMRPRNDPQFFCDAVQLPFAHVALNNALFQFCTYIPYR